MKSENSEQQIKIRNLAYQYPDGARGLAGMAIDVFAGECVGLIGPNGAGKSTLIKHLNGLLRGQGDIEVLGMPVVRANLLRIRSKLGMVFQNPDNQLFMPSVYEDVMFGPLNFGLDPGEAAQKTEKVLREFRLWELRKRQPLHLSLGEKKKVALATVLVLDPVILVLDEPLVSLDPASRRQMGQLIHSLKMTRIIASHDLEMMLELCDRVILIDEGKAMAAGLPADIMGNRELMENHRLEVPVSLRVC